MVLLILLFHKVIRSEKNCEREKMRCKGTESLNKYEMYILAEVWSKEEKVYLIIPKEKMNSCIEYMNERGKTSKDYELQKKIRKLCRYLISLPKMKYDFFINKWQISGMTVIEKMNFMFIRDIEKDLKQNWLYKYAVAEMKECNSLYLDDSKEIEVI